jgi:phage terminase large subunit
MTTATLEKRIAAPEIRGAIWQLGSCHDTEVGLDGPGGTGKTFGILYYIHTLLLMYAGAKFLVARKYNTDLAGSALATYRDDVLDPDENIHFYHGSKEKPPAYMYPNGSLLIPNGLDKHGKVRSMEFDGIYINEATECSINDIEFCRMRLRKGKIPWQQLIMDFNPDAPTHFLNQRMIEGRTTRLLSRHEDNPRYWDRIKNDWTEEGRRYVLGVLGGLTGVRLARYRFGIWAAAEGAIYQDSWDRARNVVAPFKIPASWPRYLCLDFGYTHPFVCKWYAEDSDGRFYCYREIYKTQRLVEDHVKQIKALSRWGQPDGDPLPRQIFRDHDAEDAATFERHSGLYTTAAYKSVSEGIQATASRLRPAGDGKPRLMYFANCLVERDQELVRMKKPTCSIEEFDSYVWKQGSDGQLKDEPAKEDDHGMDTDRYLCATKDLKQSGVSYAKSIWR